MGGRESGEGGGAKSGGGGRGDKSKSGGKGGGGEAGRRGRQTLTLIRGTVGLASWNIILGLVVLHIPRNKCQFFLPVWSPCLTKIRGQREPE